MIFPKAKKAIKFREVEVPFTIIDGKKHFGRRTLEEFGITDWPIKYGMEHDWRRDSYFYPPNTAEDLGNMILKERSIIELRGKA